MLNYFIHYKVPDVEFNKLSENYQMLNSKSSKRIIRLLNLLYNDNDVEFEKLCSVQHVPSQGTRGSYSIGAFSEGCQGSRRKINAFVSSPDWFGYLLHMSTNGSRMLVASKRHNFSAL